MSFVSDIHDIKVGQQQVIAELKTIHEDLQQANNSLATMTTDDGDIIVALKGLAEDIKKLLAVFSDEVVGIKVSPGEPTTH